MSMHIFQEPEPGMVAHTKMSKYFTLPYVNDWLSFAAQEGWPAATRASVPTCVPVIERCLQMD